MKINIFVKKRKEANIEQTDMAERLGISPKLYEEIERNQRPMPSNLMNKFFGIVNSAKKESNKERLEKAQKEVEVNDFYEEITKDSKQGLLNYMEKFNIKNFVVLGELIGYSPSTISNYVNHPETANYSFRNKLKLFFEDELNIQPKELPKPKKANVVCEDYSADYVLSVEEVNEIKGMITEHGLSLTGFCAKFDFPASTLMHLLNGREHSSRTRRRLDEAIKRMKEYYEELNKEEESETLIYCEPKENVVQIEEEPVVVEFNHEEEQNIVEQISIPTKVTFQDFYKGEKEMTLEELIAKRDKAIEDVQAHEEKIHEMSQDKKLREQTLEVAKNFRYLREAFEENGFDKEFIEKFLLTLTSNIDFR